MRRPVAEIAPPLVETPEMSHPRTGINPTWQMSFLMTDVPAVTVSMLMMRNGRLVPYPVPAVPTVMLVIVQHMITVAAALPLENESVGREVSAVPGLVLMTAVTVPDPVRLPCAFAP